MLRIALVVSPRQRNLPGSNEASQVVDVAVRLIVDDTLAKPDDPIDAEIRAQPALDLTLIQRWIPIAVEQTLLRNECRAGPVRVNGSPLVDHRGAIAIVPLDLQHLARHQVILVPWEIQPALQATPGVEWPVDASNRAARVDDERRADVAHPAVVMRHLDHSHLFRQQCTCVLEMLARSTHGDGLEFGDSRSDTHERLLRRPCHLTPVVRSFRPEHPATRMRLELAGHPEAVGGGGRGQSTRHLFLKRLCL